MPSACCCCGEDRWSISEAWEGRLTAPPGWPPMRCCACWPCCRCCACGGGSGWRGSMLAAACASGTTGATPLA